jgi:C-terminal processing protease CtpA/Prc
MNIRRIIIILAAATLGAGGVYQLLRPADRPHAGETVNLQRSLTTAPERVDSGAKRKELSASLTEPKPKPTQKAAITPAKAAPSASMTPPEREPPKRPDPAQYWEVQARRFNRLLERFAGEQDPSRRKALIRALAGYVRIDTLGTLDWAMSLQDPYEKNAALEAISKSSLSGIGARIETDETGFPKIRETTVLSAIAATGQVEPGDYITGMIDSNGRPISFEGLSMQQVVKHLRGEPGSEVQLLMERVPGNGSGETYIFDVPVQRSMLIIQPPY